mmetsp:Transcript_29823/g.54133  ORF Transcript_29823/g.54133 Transcript_29823/m.54133 type:complete len:330 (-) Transcript_29823:63-1052(-)|eukprot:CAMPEP_0201872088 /NCGR_PEP_ID=MMETSP0902-20130614/4871_1 /ASSEMBLY_ACC=CAM_ASM_000551 /TAXON_ID=420261 /ORGANISM="Thalassiosira antarctica, Strain CCMP982" /LENGTH=329 /DNA_ID=CAMNT_0048398267 /DNA_START=62 /DNA_END=1051 /DNA_ORIENTATION=+
MIKITFHVILVSLCLSLHRHQSIAFHPPSALLVAPSCSTLRHVSVLAARCDEDDGQDSTISRRNVISRSIYGVGLTLAASITNVERGNALDLPNFLVASEGDRGVKGMPVPSKKLGGLSNKIRSVSKIMDELQRDLMQERWDLVEGYPNQLRSYVPLFTAYTDSAFPTDIPTDKGLRVALRYEVGRFFASLERFRQATNRKSLDEAYIAYSDMSLHFDRYLRVGGLYTFYDDTISLEPYYQGVADASLVYADIKKDPALVRDLVVLIKGPEKGRTGIVIGIYPDGSNTCAVKLDRNRGIREIRVVQQSWAAKRLGEQDPDDVFLIPQSG